MKIKLSKRAFRRLEHTSNWRQESEECSDGRKRRVQRFKFDIGRFLDRSKKYEKA